MSDIDVTASGPGRELLQHRFIDQVVHDYGDLCQAITGLAFDEGAPIQVDEFRTLNRCLDNAIADAFTEFAYAPHRLMPLADFIAEIQAWVTGGAGAAVHISCLRRRPEPCGRCQPEMLFSAVGNVLQTRSNLRSTTMRSQKDEIVNGRNIFRESS